MQDDRPTRDTATGALTRAVVESYGQARGRVVAADPGAHLRQLGEVLEGVVEDGRSRAAALTGRPVPHGSHWRWAGIAAVAGAVAGAGVAVAVRRLVGQDAPGAQDPEQLQAVVDLAVVRAGLAPPTQPATG